MDKKSKVYLKLMEMFIKDSSRTINTTGKAN